MATAHISKVVDEVLDFLVSAPTPEQIIPFHASDIARNGYGCCWIKTGTEEYQIKNMLNSKK
jgi:hypothetical protein